MKYKFNLQASIASTAGNSKFLDIPKDGSIRVRLLPPTEEDGSLFTAVANHYNFKEDDRSVALACTKLHGDGECFLCDLSEYLQKFGDAGEKKVGKSQKGIQQSKSWYFQACAAIKDPETGEWSYGDPKLVRVPKTGAEAITEILASQQRNEEPFLFDPENGKDVEISRDDSGRFTSDSALPVGVPSNLDDMLPDWETKMFTDITEELSLRVRTIEEQITAARTCYPSLDWSKIESNMGV
jgi:hypothetical protein